MTTRNLTEVEGRLVTLIKEYESALDQRYLTMSIRINEEGFGILKRAADEWGLFSFISGETRKLQDKDGSIYYRVSFHVVEFEKYIHFVLNQSGMALLPNAKLCFPDGFTVQV